MLSFVATQVSKALLAEYLAVQKKKKPFEGLGLEHMNGPLPVIPAELTSSTLRSSKFQVRFLLFLAFNLS
jgi:acyl-CoA oxidase